MTKSLLLLMDNADSDDSTENDVINVLHELEFRMREYPYQVRYDIYLKTHGKYLELLESKQEG